MQERQADHTAVWITQRCDPFTCRTYFGDAATRVLEHDAAIRIELKSAVDPVEQGCADLVLQARQCARKSRLSDVELGSSICHVLRLSQHHKPMQLVQVHRGLIRLADRYDLNLLFYV